MALVKLNTTGFYPAVHFMGLLLIVIEIWRSATSVTQDQFGEQDYREAIIQLQFVYAS